MFTSFYFYKSILQLPQTTLAKLNKLKPDFFLQLIFLHFKESATFPTIFMITTPLLKIVMQYF